MSRFDNPPDHASIDNAPAIKPAFHSFDTRTGNFSRCGIEISGNLIVQPLTYRWDYRTKIRFDLMFLSRYHQPGWICLSEHDALNILAALEDLSERGLNFYSVFLCLAKRQPDAKPLYRPEAASYYWASKYECRDAGLYLANLPLNPWEII